MKSAGHCNNIMSASVNQIGVGYYCDAGNSWKHLWTQDFGEQPWRGFMPANCRNSSPRAATLPSMVRPRLLACLVALAACGEAPVAAEAPVIAAPPPAPPTPAKSPAAPARAPVERPARRSASEAEKAALQAYNAEMQTGRTQTKAKAYADAIAAFDRALVQRPQHPRALAERGYAKLLARDLPGARADLEAARERTSDPARLGPIWFNLGLVEEAAGDAEAAKRAFTRANELRPGKAVQAKLAGATVCTAEIDRAPKSGKRHASWKALYDHLARDGHELPALTDPAEIQKALCLERPGQGKVSDLMWALCFYPTDFHNSHENFLAGPGDAGAVVVYSDLGLIEGSSCQNSGVLQVQRVGALLHARYVEFGRGIEAMPLDQRADCEDEYDSCEFECTDLSATVDDYIIDPAGAQQILRVRRTTNTVPRTTDERQSVEPEVIETALPVRVAVSETGVKLSGGGCDETIAIVRPAP